MGSNGRNIGRTAPAVMRAILVAASLPAAALIGCGGGGGESPSTHNAQTSAAKTAEPALASCPGERKSYTWGKEMVGTGREGIAEGKEVEASESLVQNGEKMIRQSLKGCASETELRANEAKICANTPEELAKALEAEDTAKNEEYIGTYEAVCGKHVPSS